MTQDCSGGALPRVRPTVNGILLRQSEGKCFQLGHTSASDIIKNHFTNPEKSLEHTEIQEILLRLLPLNQNRTPCGLSTSSCNQKSTQPSCHALFQSESRYKCFLQHLPTNDQNQIPAFIM